MPSTVTFNYPQNQPSRDEVEKLFFGLEQALEGARHSGDLKCDSAILDELTLRLQQLRERYRTCLALNDACLADQSTRMWFDPVREAFAIEINGKIVQTLKLKRTDPNKPGKVEPVFQASAFVPGSSSATDGSPRPSAKIESKLSAEVEAFYYAASKFWDLLEQGSLGKARSKFINVKMVRNQLLEHADRNAVNSFGATDHKGPVVKPMRSTEAKEAPQDPGLIINVHELLANSVARLAS